MEHGAYCFSPCRSSLYIAGGLTKFDRGSVEAAPDSLPSSSFSSNKAEWSQALTRTRSEVTELKPQFYRGNIETGSQTDLASESPQKLLYYGAAKSFNTEEEDEEEGEEEEDDEEELSEIYQPLRQAVESRPSHARSLEVPEVEDIQDIRDMEGLREHFQSKHGQTFHQSRQGGHSVTHAEYQGDDSQLTA